MNVLCFNQLPNRFNFCNLSLSNFTKTFNGYLNIQNIFGSCYLFKCGILNVQIKVDQVTYHAQLHTKSKQS